MRWRCGIPHDRSGPMSMYAWTSRPELSRRIGASVTGRDRARHGREAVAVRYCRNLSSAKALAMRPRLKTTVRILDRRKVARNAHTYVHPQFTLHCPASQGPDLARGGAVVAWEPWRFPSGRSNVRRKPLLRGKHCGFCCVQRTRRCNFMHTCSCLLYTSPSPRD